jgi:hypothetical protein
MATRGQGIRRLLVAGLAYLICAGFPSFLKADKPYFVTYDAQMEEPGNLEVAFYPVLGLPQTGQRFWGAWMELEYGAKGWWTTEVYLDGQSTRGESSLFTGYRWENRFRPLAGQHWINPVLYLEFEDINGADKTLLEVVNHDSVNDLAVPNHQARTERLREVEAKLILSSNYKGWNISENFIGEKNLSNVPWEFGYAVGVSRPLALAASSRPCSFCRENFHAGVEFYGGLGTWYQFGFSGTSQYVGPLVTWELPNGTTFKIEPTFGLNRNSLRALIRFGFSYEIPRFDRVVRRWFR